MARPAYILIAGINGAGKSSLYQLQPNIVARTKRINADEIRQSNHGDWRNQMDNFRAMRQELTEIKSAISKKQAIHVETTLAGNGKTHLDLIHQAKIQGYQITLIYVTLDKSETAIDRVRKRVAKGGHGIEPALIRRRYDQSFRNFPLIAPQCDHVIIYDNTQKIKLVYEQVATHIIFDRLQNYPWLTKLNQSKPF